MRTNENGIELPVVADLFHEARQRLGRSGHSVSNKGWIDEAGIEFHDHLAFRQLTLDLVGALGALAEFTQRLPDCSDWTCLCIGDEVRRPEDWTRPQPTWLLRPRIRDNNVRGSRAGLVRRLRSEVREECFSAQAALPQALRI